MFVKKEGLIVACTRVENVQVVNFIETLLSRHMYLKNQFNFADSVGIGYELDMLANQCGILLGSGIISNETYDTEEVLTNIFNVGASLFDLYLKVVRNTN